MSQAYVKYKIDGEMHIVPTDFIKCFDRQTFVKGAEYSVFWSPVEGETPADVFKREGYVETIAFIKPYTSANLYDEVAGYYQANVLLVADSKKELEKQIKSKRLIMPTAKGADLLAEKGKKNSGDSKKSKNVDNDELSKSKMKQLEKEGEKHTLDFLQKSLDSINSGIKEDGVKRNADQNEKIRELEKANSNLKKKNLKLEIKCEKQEAELVSLRELNYKLQEQLLMKLNFSGGFEGEFQNGKRKQIEAASASTSSHTSSINKRVHLDQEDKKIESNDDGSRSRTSSSSSSVSRSTTPSSLAEKRLDENGVTSPSSSNPNDDPTSPTAKSPEPNGGMATSPLTLHTNNGANVLAAKGRCDFELTAEQKRKAYHRVRDGIRGDSQFTRNLSLAVFGMSTLMKSSVAGEACRSIEGSVARPALCSKRIEYIEELLRQRIVLKEGITDDIALQRRTKKVRDYLRGKINDLNKPKREKKAKKDGEQNKENAKQNGEQDKEKEMQEESNGSDDETYE